MRNRTAIGIFIVGTLLAPVAAFAGNTPSAVPGKTADPKCFTSSNASTTAKNSVIKNPVKNCVTNGNGLTQETAGSSAWQIKRDFPNSPSGLYWVKNSNINSGAPIQIYADMTTDGGGWTLVVANSTHSWTSSEALLNNQSNPPSNPNDLSGQGGKYSILSYADSIKKTPSGFQYRIDAGSPQTCGGIWTANSAYSFVSTNNSNTNISLNIQWSDWGYVNDGIEEKMPYFAPEAQGVLTTSVNPDAEWWGTLIQSGRWEDPNNPVVVPWISNISSCRTPTIIWYWVR